MNDQVSNAAVSSIDHPTLPPRSRWRPWRVVFFGVSCVALAIATCVSLEYYRDYVNEKELQDAIAEADRLDPGWRFDELEAKRAVIPAGENSEAQFTKAGLSAATTLTTGTNRTNLFVAGLRLEEKGVLLAPTVRLTKPQTDALRTALQPCAAALADAHKLADWPNGRHPIVISQGFGYLVPHWNNLQLPILLLESDALLHIQDADSAQAWICCRAIMNSARSFGDEPDLLAQKVRSYYVAHAIRYMERTLAQGHVPEEDLAAAQRLVQEELKHPALLIGLRGSRALLHFDLARVEAGKVSRGEMMLVTARKGGVPSRQDEVQGYLRRHDVKPAHAWLLRYTTQAIEIAKRPDANVDVELRKLRMTVIDAPPLADKLAPKFEWIAHFTVHQAVFECARTALAAERYRLKHDRWPAAFPDLVAAGLLDQVPNDPYDGAPLRYRTTRDGVVIYSVGPNGEAKGDALDGNITHVEEGRPEFRLWNHEKR